MNVSSFQSFTESTFFKTDDSPIGFTMFDEGMFIRDFEMPTFLNWNFSYNFHRWTFKKHEMGPCLSSYHSTIWWKFDLNTVSISNGFQRFKFKFFLLTVVIFFFIEIYDEESLSSIWNYQIVILKQFYCVNHIDLLIYFYLDFSNYCPTLTVRLTKLNILGCNFNTAFLVWKLELHKSLVIRSICEPS